MKTVNLPASLKANGEYSRTIKFYTFGCKVNQYETQAIREQFLTSGFEEIGNGKVADIYLINTCTVTQRADAGSLYCLRRARRENPKAKIVVTGCLTELDSVRIRKIKAVDLIVKNSDKDKIINFFNGQTGKRANGITNFKGHTRAFLKIQDGCNNFCSYCKVPLVRGKSRSKPLSVLLKEAGRLVKNGIKEIVLCGICLGSYGKDLSPGISLVDAINGLAKIEGLLRIRLSSIEAADVSDELIERMAGSKKLCRHLHIPIQSGDDEVLKKMNRRYTRAGYTDLINKIKSRMPLVAITTDILVGFPGESDDNFRNTADLIRETAPLKTHIFPYSARKGTFAADNYKQELSPGIIKERIALLNDIAADSAIGYKKQFLNRTMEVLIEGRVKDDRCYWQGRTNNYMKVMVKTGLDLANKIINLRMKRLVKDYILAK
jgi:threonylcarbamoyladenosine tRNA methylthiotransferase MtaB